MSNVTNRPQSLTYWYQSIYWTRRLTTKLPSSTMLVLPTTFCHDKPSDFRRTLLRSWKQKCQLGHSRKKWLDLWHKDSGLWSVKEDELLLSWCRNNATVLTGYEEITVMLGLDFQMKFWITMAKVWEAFILINIHIQQQSAYHNIGNWHRAVRVIVFIIAIITHSISWQAVSNIFWIIIRDNHQRARSTSTLANTVAWSSASSTSNTVRMAILAYAILIAILEVGTLGHTVWPITCIPTFVTHISSLCINHHQFTINHYVTNIDVSPWPWDPIPWPWQMSRENTYSLHRDH